MIRSLYHSPSHFLSLNAWEEGTRLAFAWAAEGILLHLVVADTHLQRLREEVGKARLQVRSTGR